MSLRARLNLEAAGSLAKTAAPAQRTPRPEATPKRPVRRSGQRPQDRAAVRELRPGRDCQDLKFQVHHRLFDLLDVAQIDTMSQERNGEEIARATERILDEDKVALTQEERQRLVREIQDEVFGLGPLEPLLRDPSVCDILVNGPASIYVERAGRIEETTARFRDDTHLMRIIERIASHVGRHIDEAHPMVDARLEDGSRVNAIIPPLALDGPTLSIRRFVTDSLTPEDLVRFGTFTRALVATLEAAVRARLNILVSGGTGAGKTTLLNVLSGFVPEHERIITIEDSAELQLRQRHVVRLETRPANVEGRGAITQRELLVNSLRMRPDRIILGEVRSGEALDMLQAMNTGHDGSLTTVHANSPRDALMRIETMVAMTGLELPQMVVRRQIASAIHLVCQQARLSDGSRRVTSVQEIVGMEGDVISMQEIFTLRRDGVDDEGRVLAELVPTGIRPRFLEKLAAEGIALPEGSFESAPGAGGRS